MPAPLSEKERIVAAAKVRVNAVLPDVEELAILPASKGYLIVYFKLDGQDHGFRLMRRNAEWHLREWTCQGEIRTAKPSRHQHFEQVIVSTLGRFVHSELKVVDMRCPVDGRRLFGKLIIQTDDKPGSTLIEFSCPQCKRINQKVTKHYFNDRGKLVKTEGFEPWSKTRPSSPWQPPTPQKEANVG
jgi:phage FluMu protein Com